MFEFYSFEKVYFNFINKKNVNLFSLNKNKFDVHTSDVVQLFTNFSINKKSYRI